MGFETITGIAASVFTSTSLIPQLIKIWKEKQSKDISIVMLAVLFAGLALWVWYGSLKGDLIIIISNAFALLINVLIGILTLYYKPKKNE
jgi:MtN3 and saliva related transmembrane protein